jgi:hypothetical protein
METMGHLTILIVPQLVNLILMPPTTTHSPLQAMALTHTTLLAPHQTQAADWRTKTCHHTTH